jgi:ribosomal protein S18 acetylase RimI-like enzyme
MENIAVRRAEAKDRPRLGSLGAALLRLHYAYDRHRFMAPGSDPEAGYAWFLGGELRRDDVVVLVAESAGNVVGYVYAGIEPLSWKELRDEAGFIHDVVVDPSFRRAGVAQALMGAALDWLRDRGMPRVVLWTAEGNVEAQRLFIRMGFRRTMFEMTREL